MAPRPTVSVIPLTVPERTAFLEAEAARYAEAKSRAGIWKQHEAPARAREEFRQLLHGPRGMRDHAFYKGVDAAGREVGWAWVGPVPDAKSAPHSRWLFQILVKEELRGRGLGRALLQAVEDATASSGAETLGLNVWAFNTIARSLYESAGYETVARYPEGTEMRKRLVSK